MSQPVESSTIVHNHLENLLSWRAAHVDLERATKNVPPEDRGVRPADLPFSLWELLEHIRIAQADILEYCERPDYTTPNWPDDFWPPDPVPPTPEAWQESIDAIRRDQLRLIHLLSEVDVTQRIPHAEEHTYLREILLVADHTAYHLGQMVVVRRLLGSWPP